MEVIKRGEDAAKPELERLEAAINKMESCCDLKPFPWWYPELGLRFERFADSMRAFVREGEDT